MTMAKSTAKKIEKTETPTEAKPKVPELPMTVGEAAAYWNLSPTRIRVLCNQNRIDHIKKGTGGRRRSDGTIGARTILITQLNPPEPVEPGSLSEEQRAVKSR
jgi:hypothetical protein